MSLSALLPRSLHVLGPGARRFLLFSFFNTLAWQTLVGSVLILHARALGLSSAWVGVLVSLMPFTMILQLPVTSLLERYGPKPLMLRGWTLRNLAAIPLVATPMVHRLWGTLGAGAVLFTGVIAFCLCRAMTGVGWFPWLQEIVPATERGRYFSFEMVVVQLVNITVGVGVFCLLRASPGLGSFSLICGLGVCSGLFSVYLIRLVPGGGPRPIRRRWPQRTELLLALRDRGFRQYATWSSVGIFVAAGQGALLILLLRDYLAVTPAHIMLITALGSGCAMVAGPWWGAMADRHGSGPVQLLSGLASGVALCGFGGIDAGTAGMPLEASLYALAAVGSTGFFIASSRGFLHRMRVRLRGAYTSVWTVATSVAMGTTAVLVGQFLRGGHAHAYQRTCIGYGLLISLAAVVCGRLVEKGRALRQELRRRYQPTRPFRSVLRISWYLLGPWDDLR